METSLSWVATIATIAAATITASNLGSRITGYGFVVFTAGSIAWFSLGIATGQPALTWTNAALTFLNLFGIWRWLGRQAKVEDGAEAASRASEQSVSPSLFPASLLTKSKVCDANGREMGQSIDAMMEVRTGRPVYLVISEGGVGGVGETLRRLPWSEVTVQRERLQASFAINQLAGCEEIDRTEWPAR